MHPCTYTQHTTYITVPVILVAMNVLNKLCTYSHIWCFFAVQLLLAIVYRILVHTRKNNHPTLGVEKAPSTYQERKMN